MNLLNPILNPFMKHKEILYLKGLFFVYCTGTKRYNCYSANML